MVTTTSAHRRPTGSLTDAVLPVILLLVTVLGYQKIAPVLVARVIPKGIEREALTSAVQSMRQMNPADVARQRHQLAAERDSVTHEEATLPATPAVAAFLRILEMHATDRHVTIGAITPTDPTPTIGALSAPYRQSGFTVTLSGRWANVVGLLQDMAAASPPLIPLVHDMQADSTARLTTDALFVLLAQTAPMSAGPPVPGQPLAPANLPVAPLFPTTPHPGGHP